MATVTLAERNGKVPAVSRRLSLDEFARRESLKATLRDCRYVANKAAGWIKDSEFSALADGAGELAGVWIEVFDGATCKRFAVGIPGGLSRYNIAERLRAAIVSQRERAGCESWRLCLAPPWLLS